MPSPLRRTVYAGTLIYTSTPNTLFIREHTLVGVDEGGRIAFLAEAPAGEPTPNSKRNPIDGGNSGKDVGRGYIKRGEDNGGLSERRNHKDDERRGRAEMGEGKTNETGGRKGGGEEGMTENWVEEIVRGWGWGERKAEGEGEGWELVRAGRGRWWFPGFVDTHIHASQYPNAGLFGKSTLLDWLNTYTFPLEASLSDLSKARNVYSACVKATLRHGTTTAAYYATIHPASTNLLAEICLAAGQRAFIGRCAMDSTQINPAYYRDASAAAALDATRATIAHMARLDPTRTLISPIITPRFAPSCSEPLLAALGALAKQESLPIQTHISENPAECALVADIFPVHGSYAAVYDAHQLLTPRTVLAHAIHLSAEERALVKKRGAKVSHCPVSNSCLSSGLCPVRELLEAGIEVGLGTDVSGGWSPSVLVAAREAGVVSRILAGVQRDFSEQLFRGKDAGLGSSLPSGGREGATTRDDSPATTDGESAPPSTSNTPGQPSSPLPPPHPPPVSADHTKLSIEECLYLATVGGARCLGLERTIGTFEVGMMWDAQLVSLAVELEQGQGQEQDGGVQHLWWGRERWTEKVAKWVFCGDDRNTKVVWVAGRVVHRRR